VIDVSGVWLWVPGVNPEPWTAGTHGKVRRKGGGEVSTVMKDAKLTAYQAALRDEFARLHGYTHKRAANEPVWMRFLFWRSTMGGQPADATNLQKATEDALQGLVYANDRAVHRIESSIQEQAPDTEGAVLIWIADEYEPVSSFPEIPTRTTTLEEDMRRRETLPKDVF